MELDEYLESLMKTEAPAQFPLSMYYSEAVKYIQLRLYEKALSFLDIVLGDDPMNVKSLLMRSRCLLALRQFQKAKEDAVKALRFCPGSIEAMNLKGKAEYMMGDFEGGYLTYINGREMKPLSEELRLGVQLCKDAMDNSMYAITVKDTDIASLSDSPKDGKHLEAELLRRVPRKELFGSDLKFLEDLMTDKNMKSVHGICKETMNFIRKTQTFWCEQMPVFTRKKISRPKRRVLKRRSVAETQIYICKATKRRCELNLRRRCIDDCVAEGEKLLATVELIPEEQMQQKMRLKSDAFHLLGLAYRKAENETLALRYFKKELKIAERHGVTLAKIRALHHIGEHSMKNGDVQKAFQCLEELTVILDSEEVAEMSRICRASGNLADLEELEVAQSWWDSFESGIYRFIRSSIIAPVVDAVVEFAMKAQNRKPVENNDDLELDTSTDETDDEAITDNEELPEKAEEISLIIPEKSDNSTSSEREGSENMEK